MIDAICFAWRHFPAPVSVQKVKSVVCLREYLQHGWTVAVHEPDFYIVTKRVGIGDRTREALRSAVDHWKLKRTMVYR